VATTQARPTSKHKIRLLAEKAQYFPDLAALVSLPVAAPDSAAIILHKNRVMVIMEACKLSSKRRVATTACAALRTPGIVE
jgi:hypothetical protein